jgi:2-(1,2-epoxy-1,2-dihydrophenyl)acetyl-CoA isomerase
MGVEMTKPVLLSVEAGIAEIRFNRPERLNALDRDLADGFADAVIATLAEPSVRVIVVSAEGRGFVVGGDLGHFHKSADKSKAARELIDSMHGAIKMLAAAPQIVIGSLKGAVAGGGMSLALSLDLLVAADDTAFNLAYSRLGTSPDCGGSWSLPRLVGYRRALEIALLSETIGADEALRLGLVNRVVPRPELETATRQLAEKLAAGAPAAQAHIKRLFRASLESSFCEQLDAEAEAFAACASTADFAEGIDAFFAKRKPVFTGR